MFSFVPLRNPIGFGAVDYAELVVALLLLALALLWRPWIAPAAVRFARRPLWCMAALCALPIVLRLLLLPDHPVPVPDLYDEFGHLLVADTLRHWRLANPAHPLHQFFETFFVLQQPTYSAIYPMGNGLVLALGWMVFGTPWAGVLLSTGAFCGLCYWMLRGWATPGWALLGGLLAAMQFGPLNLWTNGYWGGSLPAAAGCLVFGALPRLRNRGKFRDGALLGLGLAIHALTRPYESIFLAVSVALYFIPELRRRTLPWRALGAAGLVLLPALGVTLLQNKRVTGEWTTLPYTLSQYRYGVPASLTFQTPATPHGALTPQQELDYRMQRNFHPGNDTLRSYAERLAYRFRYYRFYFYAPLYLALLAFLATIRDYRWAWVAMTCLLFALGVNFFPAFQFHYVAAVVCLFILMSVRGLQQIERLRHGPEAARLIIFFCIAHFVFWYALHIPDRQDFAARTRAFDVWDSIDHGNPERRIDVRRQLDAMPGKLLILVRYWPQHVFQDEWVYNGADIDSQRVVWARDLGDEENKKLTLYYKDRKAMLFEPDFRPPRLDAYEPAPVPEAAPTSATPPVKPATRPLLELEQVR